MKSNPAKAILTTWLLAGTLDILAAFTQYMIGTGGKNPVNVLLFIASGVFGRETAFSGGYPMAALGLAFHYFIALSWTLLFFFAYPKMNILAKNKFATGIAYGIVIWLVMNQIVLPLSNVSRGAFDLGRAALGTLVLMVCVGLPISFTIGKYYSQSNKL